MSRRFLGWSAAILLCTLGAARAFQNLTLNGQPAVTVTRGDPVLVSGFFAAPGDTAVMRIYYDLNNNGTLDADDPLLDRSFLWDGSWADLDETANGQYQDTLKTEGIPQGTYFLQATDPGGAAQATLTVVESQTGIQVTGTVAVPPLTPGLLVFFLPADSGQTLPPFNGFTNHLGTFSLWLPPEYEGTHWIPMVYDFLVQAPGFVSPLNFDDTVTITAPVTTVNLSLLPSDGTEIQGTLQDDAGDPLPIDSVTVFTFGMYTNFVDTSYALATARVLGGSFTLQVMGPFGFYQVSPLSYEPYVPRYLAPGEQLVILTGSSAQTTLTAYQTNATITGHVYFDDNQPADGIQLMGDGYIMGNPFAAGHTYTGTYSDGHYEMWVSSSLAEYEVSVDPSTVPDSFYVAEGTQTVAPGATGVDFHLYPMAVAESPAPRPSLMLSGLQGVVRRRLAFTLETSRDLDLQVDLYNAAGRRVARLGTVHLTPGTHALSYTLPTSLPGGTYLLVLQDSHRILRTHRFVKVE